MPTSAPPPPPPPPNPNPLRSYLNLDASEVLAVSFDIKGGVDSGWPDRSPSFWLSPDAKCNFEALGADALGIGIESVSIVGSYTLICVAPALGLAQQHQGDISNTATPRPGTTSDFLGMTMNFNLRDYITECHFPYMYKSFELELQATVTNLQGQTVTTPALSIRNTADTPLLRVATFNIGGDQSALTSNPDPQLQRYGNDLLSQVDVAFLQEVEYSDWVGKLSASSGLLNQYSDGSTCTGWFSVFGNCVEGHSYPDVAIISRYPLWGESYDYIHGQKVIDAKVSIGSSAYRLIATHLAPGDNRSGDRVSAATAVVTRLQGETNPVIVGGDFNSSPFSQEHDVLTQQAGLVDAYNETRLNQSRWPNVQFCSGEQPTSRGGDWILFKGPYTPTVYQSCLNSDPSDHSCVIADLGRAWYLP
ncbi:endonuclease/exonuclease/phosphatase family protein [Streptomyces sp. NPDC040750]|uniref:endonuclease/exonuclease/phosphatase family protein n=1 Tax=Streptomyces sp. NPDC040750 TaxID=3154491 RepID=UPI0033D6B144